MSQIEANCPHCGTSFSVTNEQLQIANGHVRCGVCMKVFKVGGGATASVKDSSEKEVKLPNLDDDASIEAWIQKNQKKSSGIISGPVEAPTEFNEGSLSIDDELSDEFENFNTGINNDDEKKDFTMMVEDDEEAPKVKAATPAYKAQLEDSSDDEIPLTDAISRGQRSVHAHQIPTEKPAPQKRAPANDLDDLFADDLFGSDDDDEPVLQVALGSADIEDEPSFESRLKPHILWPSLSVAMILLLVAQVAIKNFERYAIDPDYRPIYSVFCSIGFCELPTLRNVSSIRGSNLVVRPHPKQPGALIVDAIINNRAPFDQAFPELYLSFSNIQGQVIASRIFKPNEYLTGELKGMSIMPSQSPLHLSLEVLDPGEQAVSYHLDFVQGS